MRPRPYRKVVSDLHALVAGEGMTLEASTGGKGSHRTLTVVDAASRQRAPIILAGTKEISSEVQRKTLAYLKRRVGEFAPGHPTAMHHERVRTILDRYFNS